MSPTDSANLAAQWASFTITALGLGSLVTQAGAIRNSLDSFHGKRGADSLGVWVKRQQHQSWYQFVKQPPQGPRIEGTYSGLFGRNMIYVSRRPVKDVGKASWTAILKTLHPQSLISNHPAIDALPWELTLKIDDLVRNRDKVCTKITRTGLIICLVVSNAYQDYKYSGDAGLRVSYSGYTGSWQIQWPLGGSAEVEFFQLDSHDPATETHPITFPRRVDKCISMLLGIIEAPALGRLGFSEPKELRFSVLQWEKQGFSVHGKTTHLTNMMGRNSFEVDYLVRRPLLEADKPIHNMLELSIPPPEEDLNRRPIKYLDQGPAPSTVFVPEFEQLKLATSLDCLPWSALGWSIHRGMQSLLIAYGKPIMNAYRQALAYTLENAINANAGSLRAWGWRPDFIAKYMGVTAAASVKMEVGNNGDNVRIVTDAALLLTKAQNMEQLDETRFWRRQVAERDIKPVPEKTPLDSDTVTALTKMFVLNWSNELDHRLFQDLPPEILIA